MTHMAVERLEAAEKACIAAEAMVREWMPHADRCRMCTQRAGELAGFLSEWRIALKGTQ